MNLIPEETREAFIDEVCTIDTDIPAIPLQELRDWLVSIQPSERPQEHRTGTFYENGQRDILQEIIETVEEEL